MPTCKKQKKNEKEMEILSADKRASLSIALALAEPMIDLVEYNRIKQGIFAYL